MMVHPLLHFICGSTGAGKTTYASRLARELNGVRFSIDEWMSALFWMDTPDPISTQWCIERIERCSGLILRTAFDVAGAGIPCILEVGLTTRLARATATAKAHEAGFASRLHYIDVDPQERWRRVELRNASASEAPQLGFAITRDMFDFVETMWEPPADDELADGKAICISPVKSKG